MKRAAETIIEIGEEILPKTIATEKISYEMVTRRLDNNNNIYRLLLWLFL